MTGLNERQPIFNVPGVVLALLVAMAAVHAIRTYVLSVDADNWCIQVFAFIPGRYTEFGAELPGAPWAGIVSFVSHAFLHGNFTHLALNSIWLLAFGGAIARRIGTVRFLLFFAFAATVGAITFLFLNWGLMAPVVGASGALAGLMAASLRIILPAIAAQELWKFRIAPQSLRLPSLPESLHDRQILFATAIWVALNILAAIGLGSDGAPGAIAWEAHVGGYLSGLFAFGLFDVQLRNEDVL